MRERGHGHPWPTRHGPLAESLLADRGALQLPLNVHRRQTIPLDWAVADCDNRLRRHDAHDGALPEAGTATRKCAFSDGWSRNAPQTARLTPAPTPPRPPGTVDK